MYHFTVPFLASFPFYLFQSAAAVPDPEVQIRQDQDLSYCYGENSICEFENNLWEECSSYQSPYNAEKWYNCICSNGYVSVEDACYWCQLAYNLDISYNGPLNKGGCSSVGVSIAPIPSSIVSAESVYNQTYTAMISGSKPTGTGSPGLASTSGDSNPTALTASPGSGTVQSTAIYGNGSPNFGITSVTTLYGGAPATTTSALGSTEDSQSASATTSVIGSPGNVGTQGKNGDLALLCSLVASWFSILIVL